MDNPEYEKPRSAKRFKKNGRMNNKMELNIDELIHIANQLEKKVKAGLWANNQEIACLPTYVPVFKISKTGRALVLDLGGTNARAAIISWEDGNFFVEKRTSDEKVPWQRERNITCQNYLNFQYELLASLDPPDNLPLGYCFSYPTESNPNGDAKLIEWTKEVFVPDTEGRMIGSMLIEYLHEKGIHCSNVTVINDTIASLMNGLVRNKADLYIGLIVGTGTNMAAIIEPQMIPKLKARNPDWKHHLPINLESGNFAPPYLTSWDNSVDFRSENPGKHRFEKAVSGRYLGQLLKAILPDCEFDQESGSEGVVRLAYEDKEVDSRQIEVARQILERSAKFVAASLAGLIKVLNPSKIENRVNIVAEGGLISCKRSGYGELTKSTLKCLLEGLELAGTTVIFDYGMKDTNFIGSALAAVAR